MAKRRPSGDGMVRKRDDGRWEGRIVVGHKENGNPIFQYVLASTQKALLPKLHQNIETFRDVELCEDSRMTLAQWLDRWLDEYAAPRLRESTMSGYRMYAEQYIKPRLGNKKMNSINAVDIQRMYTKLKKEGRIREHPEQGRALSAGTIRRIHTMLHRAFGDAVKAHIIPHNPAEGLTLPKADCPAKRVLTDRELDKFMEAIQADPFWHDFFYTELTTGLRRGEICGLQWRDFDPETGTLQISRTLHKKTGGGFETGETKTGRGRRKILLPQSTADMLRVRQEAFPGKWIFPNPLKPEQPVSPDAAYRRLKFLLREAGITESIPFHGLRHPNVKSKTKIFYPLFLNNHSKIREHRRVPSPRYSLLQKFFDKFDLSVCCLRIIAHTDGRFKLWALTYASNERRYPFRISPLACWGSPKPRTGRYASSRTRLTAWLHASHDQQGENDVTASGGGIAAKRRKGRAPWTEWSDASCLGR